MRDYQETKWQDGVSVGRYSTLTVIRNEMLKKRVKAKQHTILAAGAARGGTSMLSYTLNHLGYLKEGNLHPKTHEDLDFEKGRSPDDWLPLIARNDRKHDVWGVKLPAISRHMEFFERSTRNSIFVVVIRNPLDVSMSQIRRSPRFDHSLEGMAKAYADCAGFYDGFFNWLPSTKSPVIMVAMEMIQRSPRLFVGDLMQVLGLDQDQGINDAIANGLSSPGYKTMQSAKSS